jgi:hypothetical protein
MDHQAPVISSTGKFNNPPFCQEQFVEQMTTLSSHLPAAGRFPCVPVMIHRKGTDGRTRHLHHEILIANQHRDQTVLSCSHRRYLQIASASQTLSR